MHQLKILHSWKAIVGFFLKVLKNSQKLLEKKNQKRDLNNVNQLFSYVEEKPNKN